MRAYVLPDSDRDESCHEVSLKIDYLDSIRGIIGCPWLELLHLDDDHGMMVDEEGRLTGQPVNMHTPQLYPGVIVGTAVIVGLDRVAGDLVPVSDGFLESLVQRFET